MGADPDELRRRVVEANRAIARHGLALFTWGNASAIDRESRRVAIKPSGVAYDRLAPDDIVLIDLASGGVAGGSLRPSTDTPTHLAIYRAFAGVGGIVHVHSHYATAWAQAGRDLPCFGTTHADYFHGPVPCTSPVTDGDLAGGADYEQDAGDWIVAEFARRGLDPLDIPAVLLCGHAPFVWGESVEQAVENAVVLEEVARLALHTLALRPEAGPICRALHDKHFLRKHGRDAYYGQGRDAG